MRDEIVECANLMFGRARVAFPVTCCTSYSDRRQPALREMEEMAHLGNLQSPLESTIRNRIANHQSESPIVDRQSVNRHSAIASPQ